MIKAVIFDMFETLVSLFEGRTYYSENIASDVGVELDAFRKEWHAIEKERSTGKYTIEEGLEFVLRKLGVYSEEKVKMAADKRKECLRDSFSGVTDETIALLDGLRKRKIKIGLISNMYSDERDLVRQSKLMPYFDEALISYEQGICKPDISLFVKMTKLLKVKPDECLYVGDGGSGELYSARTAGMHPVQCTWFHGMAFEPHIPCPILDEFDHAEHQLEILDFVK